MTTISELNIGTNIKAFRKGWGWSMRELAIKSGISKGLISKLESDPKFNVTVATLVALANAFEVQVTELISRV